MNPRQYRVIAGPYRVARRYAASMGWADDEYVIVVRAHQLARMDPATIGRIVTVRLQAMGQRIAQEIQDEIDQLRALWPVPMIAAA